MWKNRSKPFKRIFVILAILLVIYLVEQFVHAFVNKKGYGLRYSRRVTAIENRLKRGGGAQLLVMGDSSCGAAIDAEVFGKQITDRIAVVSLPARLSMMIEFYSLRAFLEENDSLEYIILVTSPVYHSNGEFLPEYFVDHFFNLPDVLDMYRHHVIGLDDILFRFSLNSMPSYRYRYGIRRYIDDNIFPKKMGVKTITVKKKSVKKLTTKERRARLKTSEMIRRQPQPKNIAKSLKKFLRWAKKDGYQLNRNNEYYLKKLISLAANKNITVYYQVGPVYTKYYNTSSGRKLFNAAMIRMTELVQRYQNFKILDNRIQTFPLEKLYNNCVHLNPEGAVLFSREVVNSFLKLHPERAISVSAK